MKRMDGDRLPMMADVHNCILGFASTNCYRRESDAVLEVV